MQKLLLYQTCMQATDKYKNKNISHNQEELIKSPIKHIPLHLF